MFVWIKNERGVEWWDSFIHLAIQTWESRRLLSSLGASRKETAMKVSSALGLCVLVHPLSWEVHRVESLRPHFTAFCPPHFPCQLWENHHLKKHQHRSVLNEGVGLPHFHRSCQLDSSVIPEECLPLSEREPNSRKKNVFILLKNGQKCLGLAHTRYL